MTVNTACRVTKQKFISNDCPHFNKNIPIVSAKCRMFCFGYVPTVNSGG